MFPCRIATGAHCACISFDRPRPADVMPLDAVAGLLGQEPGLLFSLDAVGDHRHVEAPARCNHGAANRRLLLAVAKIANKGLFDLDLVEGKKLQIRQRRIAGAKIIHGDRAKVFSRRRIDTARLKSPIKTPSEIWNSGRAAERPASKSVDESGWQIAALELCRRQVHGNLQWTWPGASLRAGSAQHLLTERDNTGRFPRPSESRSTEAPCRDEYDASGSMP